MSKANLSPLKESNHYSLDDAKAIILNDLKSGKSISSVEHIYQSLSHAIAENNLATIWPPIKKWWSKLTQILYFESDKQLLERMISSNGSIFDKKLDQWIESDKKIDPVDAKICSLFLQNLYQHDVNLRAPFKSFIGIDSGNTYRFTLQLTKPRPKMMVKIFIRINRQQIFPLSNFGLNKNDLPQKMIGNIIISGATGSGKTTLLKSLLASEQGTPHHLIIEDLNEIGTISKNATQLCSTDLGVEMRSLLVNGLRMSPDKIVLGEIRGTEIVPYLMALNSGHLGSLATIHANSATETIYRLTELLQIFGNFGDNTFSQMMKIISRNIHYVIFMENKMVKEIIKVLGSSDKGTPYFERII